MRQSGTTSALVKLAKQTGGYIIVSKNDMRQLILRNHPDLKEQIFTLREISSGKYIGLPKKPIFFDTDAVYSIVAVQSDSYISNTHEIYHNKDGYEQSLKEYQVNVKLTEVDAKNISDINKHFFEGEAGNSMLGRVLIRKGIRFYQQLINEATWPR